MTDPRSFIDRQLCMMLNVTARELAEHGDRIDLAEGTWQRDAEPTDGVRRWRFTEKAEKLALPA